jgi:hypothetical protein
MIIGDLIENDAKGFQLTKSFIGIREIRDGWVIRAG